MTQQISTTTTVSQDATGTTALTRALLACGVVGAPLFVVASLVQSSTRDGFDLKRHPFSMLSLGEHGWIQITNFVVCGLLFIACGAGMRRALRSGKGRTWGPQLIAAAGVGMIGGGVFLADPALGFPAGAPAGSPDALSWHGGLHAVAFAVGFLSLIIAIFVFAQRYATTGERGWARYCAATGAAFVVLSAVGMAGGDFRIVTVAVVIGWGWVSVMAARLAR